MQTLRKSLSGKLAFALATSALLCMLLVQTLSLHMHNHATVDHAAALHVTGATGHDTANDDSGEIDLSVTGLVLKHQFSFFGIILLAYAAVLLPRKARLVLPRPRRVTRHRRVLFNLRPPAHAPPL